MKKAFTCLLLLLFVSLLILGSATAAVPGYSAEEWAVLRLTNDQRLAYQLTPLAMTAPLQIAAKTRARELDVLFSHTRPDGRSPYTAYTDLGKDFWGGAENIAAGYRTSREVVEGWMNSPGHRANILNGSLTHIGAGLYTAAKNNWVQLFLVDGCRMDDIRLEVPGAATQCLSGVGVDQLGVTVVASCSIHGDSYLPLSRGMASLPVLTRPGYNTVTVSAFGKQASFRVFVYEQAGWHQFGDQWWYIGQNGLLATGQSIINGKNQLFDENGLWIAEIAPYTGWRLEGGNWYYFQDNLRQTGWVRDGQDWYYMDNEAVMVRGFQNIGGYSYYFYEDGSMATGEFFSSWGTIYNFDTSGRYLSETKPVGWLQRGGSWYYFEQGTQLTGWQYLEGSWYFFRRDGVMATGWLKDGNAWYYLWESGAMATGWVYTGGAWYYLSGSGIMLTGNHTIDGTMNRFASNGMWLGY